jgi:hypothetical protein
MKERFYGIVETTWSSTQSFLNGFYGNTTNQRPGRDRDPDHTAWKCFRDVYQKIDSLGN